MAALPCGLAAPFGDGSRRRINPRRRQGLAGRLGFEFGQDRPQGADARRELVFVALYDAVKLSDEGRGFVV
jgi:hypothetical protein